MKSNMFCRALVVIITLVVMSQILTIKTYATSIGDIFQGAGNFIETGINDPKPTIQEDDLKQMSDLLYNTILVIAIVITVIVGLIIGIKFMTGSVAEKAEVKETLIPYIAGCIVIFGAFGIWKLVITILSQT